MAMTDKEQKDVRAYCAFLLKEHGFDIPVNDPIIPALYIIHKEMQLSNESSKALASQMREAAARIKSTVFNFNSESAAFKFQVGIAVKWILIGALVLLFVVIAIWHWSRVNDIDQARAIIEASGNMGELMKRVQKDKEGYYFLDFTAAKADSIQHFKEYQKLDAKTVRIYVGKESK